MKDDRHAARRHLPRGFAARQTAADDRDAAGAGRVNYQLRNLQLPNVQG
jgi:hypothetical protein